VLQLGYIFKIIRQQITIFIKLYFEENCLLRCDAMYLVKKKYTISEALAVSVFRVEKR